MDDTIIIKGLITCVREHGARAQPICGVDLREARITNGIRIDSTAWRGVDSVDSSCMAEAMMMTTTTWIRIEVALVLEEVEG